MKVLTTDDLRICSCVSTDNGSKRYKIRAGVMFEGHEKRSRIEFDYGSGATGMNGKEEIEFNADDISKLTSLIEDYRNETFEFKKDNRCYVLNGRKVYFVRHGDLYDVFLGETKNSPEVFIRNIGFYDFMENLRREEASALLAKTLNAGDGSIADEMNRYLDIDVRKFLKVSEALDREYVIKAEAPDKKKLSDLLDWSGFVIRHRPYFAMYGSTHLKWTVNPFTKAGMDAAPTKAEAITYDEFLKLFA